jgi:hypothetical protein
MNSAAKIGAQSCSRCGATFHCGREMNDAGGAGGAGDAGDAQCWCSALPHVPLDRLDRQAGCLCPDCLRAKTASIERM